MIAGSTQELSSRHGHGRSPSRGRRRPGLCCSPPPSDHDLITFVLHPMHAWSTPGSSARRRRRWLRPPGRRLLRRSREADRAVRAGAGAGQDLLVLHLCPARCRYRAAAGALGEGRWNSETGERSAPSSGVRTAAASRTWLSYSYGGGGGARTTTTTPPPPWTTVTIWCLLWWNSRSTTSTAPRLRWWRGRRRFRPVQVVQVVASRSTRLPCPRSSSTACNRKAAGRRPHGGSTGPARAAQQH